MNDFGTYDSFFCGSHSQLEQQHEQVQFASHPQTTISFPQLSPPTTVVTVANHAQQQQQRQGSTSSISAGVAVAGSDFLAPNRSSIPFVQIHTTDVQPQRSGNGSFTNSFRRNNNNNHEIKSELIKSESAEASLKELLNGTPTPPVRSASCGSSSSSTAERVDTPARVAAADCAENASPTTTTPSLPPALQKCSQCPFLSLSESTLELHMSGAHGADSAHASRPSHCCPGCENVFYGVNTLLIHLREDHLMGLDDAQCLCDAVLGSQMPEKSSSSPAKDEQRSGRIYLKNVDCLREPQREPIGQQENQISLATVDSFGYENESPQRSLMDMLTEDCVLPADTLLSTPTKTKSNNKQKISIKSVDVLREPALLRRDYELQNFPIYSNSSACPDLLDLPLSSTTVTDYNYVPDANSNNNTITNYEKPRRPKIYIKNVDILKEPLVFGSELPICTANTSYSYMAPTYAAPGIEPGVCQYMSSAENLSNAAAQVYDSATLALAGTAAGTSLSAVDQYIYDSSSYLAEVEPHLAFATAHNQTNYAMLESARFDCNFDSAATSIINTTEPTPPLVLPAGNELLLEHQLELQPAPVPAPPVVPLPSMPLKQKIFIKNVDVLKAPQFQEQRRTLHLRTVDEVNLLNKNEVQNLISPNLDTSFASSATAMTCTTSIAGNLNQQEDDGLQNVKLPADLLYAEQSSETDEDNLKLQEFVANGGLGVWVDDYDLGDELDCIIMDTINPINNNNNNCNSNINNSITLATDKLLYDVETPHTMSLLGIRDNIEQLPEAGMVRVVSPLEQANEVDTELAARSEDPDDGAVVEIIETVGVVESANSEPMDWEEDVQPKCESPSIGVPNVQAAASTTSVDVVKCAVQPPPLAPVTHNVISDVVANATQKDRNTVNVVSVLPVPPLVPVTSHIQLRSSGRIATSRARGRPPVSKSMPVKPPKAQEKGRIYVANNLLQAPASPTPPSTGHAEESSSLAPNGGGTSVRGRPYGAKSTTVTKRRKVLGVKAAEQEADLKCPTAGCVFRFKQSATLDYHKRCHSSNPAQPLQIMCPDCPSTASPQQFTNWNTLHTHLWRSHKIDMELYSCPLCEFKTPIYSRLLNTHAKIHSDERNFKCDQCEKAFKNTKQLKNHRRWHRTVNSRRSQGTSEEESAPPPELHRCSTCGAAFSHRKTLREHSCKAATSGSQVCDVCGRVASSKSALKLHKLTHDVPSATKRFKCAACEYTTNDHNAFRRHKATHGSGPAGTAGGGSGNGYTCPHCPYKSIQSVAYQKHIKLKHPAQAKTLIYKCSDCSFNTINRSLFNVHRAKHDTVVVIRSAVSSCTGTFAPQQLPTDDVPLLSANEATTIEYAISASE